MARRYSPEFRRKVLDLLQAGRTVRQVAFDLQISDQMIYNWREQELIDTGQKPGITSSDHGVQFTSWAFTRRAHDSGLVPSMGSIGDCFDNAVIQSPRCPHSRGSALRQAAIRRERSAICPWRPWA